MFINAQTPCIKGNESCLALLEDVVTDFVVNEKSFMMHFPVGTSLSVCCKDNKITVIIESTLEK